MIIFDNTNEYTIQLSNEEFEVLREIVVEYVDEDVLKYQLEEDTSNWCEEDVTKHKRFIQLMFMLKDQFIQK